MRRALISNLMASVVLISSCNNNSIHNNSNADDNSNVRVFRKHTSLESASLKGKVKSIITYRCSMNDSVEHCSVYIKKYDERGSLTEEIDTIGPYFYSNKYFYNNDGLLAKHIFSASAPFPSLVDTYLYSFSEGKRTCITRNPDSLSRTPDTSVSLYDKNGNEMEYKGNNTQHLNKYDEHGFLMWSRATMPDGKTFEVTYANDDKGRMLKQTWSDGRGAQAHIYDKDGNEIQQLNYDSLGRKSSDYYTGYCEFDKYGNFLKSIGFSPQKKDMYLTRRVIEYY